MIFKVVKSTSLPSPKSTMGANISSLNTVLPVSFIFLTKNFGLASDSFRLGLSCLGPPLVILGASVSGGGANVGGD